LPPGHIAFATLVSERALNALAAGDLESAGTLSNQAVILVENLVKTGRHGADRLPVVLTRRSEVELRLGRPAAAAADATHAINILQQTEEPGALSSNLGRAYFALGSALQAEHQAASARAAFRSAAQHLVATLGPRHPASQAAIRLGRS